MLLATHSIDDIASKEGGDMGHGVVMRRDGRVRRTARGGPGPAIAFVRPAAPVAI